MTGPPALVVARVTVVELYRRVSGSTPMAVLFTALPVFFAVQLSGLFGPGAYDYGLQLAAGDAEAVGARVREATVSGLVLLGLMGVLGAGAGNSERKERYVTFLTASTTRAVVLGSVCRQVLVWTVMLWPAAAVAGVAVAAGAGRPVAALSLVGGSLWLFAVATVATVPVGFAARWLLDSAGLPKNARLGLGVGLMGGFYALLFSREQVTAALSGTPVSWAGDLLLVTVPGVDADPLAAAGFLLGTAALMAVALALSVRLAGVVWYGGHADAPEGDAGTAPVDRQETRPRAALTDLVGREAAALVETTWRRTARTPKTLWYVYPGALVGLVMAERLVYAGPFSAAMYPVVLGFSGAVAAGSGFTLNPLGTEGDALPWLLTAGVGSAAVVRAKALAVVLVAVPLVAGGALGVALAVGAPPAVALAALAFALALSVLAPLLSLAVGVHYPPDAEGLLGGSVAVPNKSASAAYTLGMLVVAAPGLGGLGQFALSGSVAPAVLAGGVGLTTLLAVVAGRLGYGHAVARLDDYSVE